MLSLICGILNKPTNELIYKTEIQLQMRKQTYGYQRVRGCKLWEISIDIYTLLYIKLITKIRTTV